MGLKKSDYEEMIRKHMQSIIEEELSKPEYQDLYNKLEGLCEKYHELADRTAKNAQTIYVELIDTLLNIREYENRMFFMNFGLIY